MFGGVSFLKLMLLIGGLLAIHETARQRRADSWPFIVFGTIGYFVVSGFAISFLGVGMSSSFGIGLGWLVLTYLSLFLFTEKGKGVAAWQCPDCRLFNADGTVECLCGARAPEAAENPGLRPPPRLTLGIWPQIRDRSGAVWAARQGMLTSAALAGAALLFGLLFATSDYAEAVEGSGRLTVTSFVVALVLAGLAYGIHRKSRLVALLGLGLASVYMIPLLISVVWVGLRQPAVVLQLFLPLFVVLQFVGSVRGTIAYHRFHKKRRLSDAEVEEVFS